MAMPSRVKTTSEAFIDIRESHKRAVKNTENLRAASAAGPTPLGAYLLLQRELSRALVTWAESIVVPGLQPWAVSQVSRQGLNMQLEHGVMDSTGTALRDWIIVNIPNESTTRPESGRPADVLISSVDTADFRALADAFIATIE
ncbi:MAG: hypothetical protein V3U60_11195 [Gammaproteobacteria bacterium]